MFYNVLKERKICQTAQKQEKVFYNCINLTKINLFYCRNAKFIELVKNL